MSDGGLKEKILAWLEKRLETESDFFLPLKKLQQELQAGLKVTVPPAEEIAAWLQEDERFNFIAIPQEPIPLPEEKKLEALGYYRGPRVGLKRRQPSPAQLTEMLRRQTEILISSLQKAYQSRPQEGAERGEIEDRLLELLQQADKIKKEIPDLEVTEEKPDK